LDGSEAGVVVFYTFSRFRFIEQSPADPSHPPSVAGNCRSCSTESTASGSDTSGWNSSEQELMQYLENAARPEHNFLRPKSGFFWDGC
jgi:hypothetical protein